MNRSGAMHKDQFVSEEVRWLGVRPDVRDERTRLQPSALFCTQGQGGTPGRMPPLAFVLNKVDRKD